MNPPVERPNTPPETLFTWAFGLAFAANFLHSLAFHTYVHVPGFFAGLGASEFVIGVLMGTMAFMAIAVRPAVGRSMDVRGRRGMILVGGVVNVIASLGYLLVNDVGAVAFGVRMLHGVAEAMLWSSLFTFAADVVPAARRAQGLALFGVSGLIPLALGGAIGDWVVGDGPPTEAYAAMFGWTAVFSVVALLLSLPLPESRPERAPGEDVERIGYLETLSSRPLLPLWFLGTAFAISLSAYWTFIKTFVETTDIGSMSLFFGAYAWSAVLLRIFFGWVPQRVGLRRVLVPAVLVAACGLVVVATAHSAWQLGLSGVLCGIGHGFAFPILSAMVVDRARAEERGTAVSLFTAMFDVGALLGGPSLGAIITLASYGVMYATAAAFLAASTLVYLAWDMKAVPGPPTEST